MGTTPRPSVRPSPIPLRQPRPAFLISPITVARGSCVPPPTSITALGAWPRWLGHTGALRWGSSQHHVTHPPPQKKTNPPHPTQCVSPPPTPFSGLASKDAQGGKRGAIRRRRVPSSSSPPAVLAPSQPGRHRGTFLLPATPGERKSHYGRIAQLPGGRGWGGRGGGVGPPFSHPTSPPPPTSPVRWHRGHRPQPPGVYPPILGRGPRWGGLPVLPKDGVPAPCLLLGGCLGLLGPPWRPPGPPQNPGSSPETLRCSWTPESSLEISGCS